MTINEIRKAKLEELIREYGSLRALAVKLDHSATAQISQWRQSSPDSRTGKPRTISDRSARAIELKCGKPFGWMDTAEESANSKDVDDFKWILEHGAENEISILLATVDAIKSAYRPVEIMPAIDRRKKA